MAQSPSERTHPGALASLPPLPPLPFVSVVIPTLNEERYIGALLDSLQGQTYPAEAMEVIVADGGSTDATRQIVAAAAARWEQTPLVLVENPARRTPEGRNAGFAVSRGEVILTLVAHTTLDSRFVEESVRALRETGAAVAGGPIEARGESPIAAAIAAAVSHPFGVGDARFRFATEPGYVDTIAFAAYRRECFDILGGFATDRDLAEDDFFNYQVRAAGGKLYLTPAVKSVYYSRSGLRPLARQYFGYGKAKGRASVEVPSSILPRHLVPGATVAGGALLLAASLVSQPARWLLAIGGLAYAGLAAYSANSAASRRDDPALAPRVALVFPVLHASYGLGTIVGAVRTLWARRPR
ncbi:MAG: glycosyltransferase family 2 protein [Chloroflexi bacterium]|nr:glycosyltransferase family 2 protein [Chloroflexota bacterium]